MSKLFLSHSSQNNFATLALNNWLINNGWDYVFLDLDPERGIVAGQRWEKALPKFSTILQRAAPEG